MSSKQGSMAAQGGADVSLTITPPLAPHNQQGHTSATFSSNSFVRSIDKRARHYLKSLERSLSFSVGESRDEDPSSMTIEFLKARLQAQRAEYKAEKQKAQQLAKRVLELEQRLNSEIERRKKAEHNDVLISSRYKNKLRSFRSFNDRMELAIPSSKFRDNSSGDEHSDCCSEISGSEDGVFLISPSSLRHRLESLRQEHHQMTNEHDVCLVKDINEASAMDKESKMSNDEEQRNKQHGGSKNELYASPSKPNGSEDFDNTNTWHQTDNMDPQPSEIVSTFIHSPSGHEEPAFSEQFLLPRVQPCTLYMMDSNIKSEKTHYIEATKEKAPQLITHHVKPMFNCQNCQQPTPHCQIRPADERTNDHLPPQHGAYALDAEKTSAFGTIVKPRLSKSYSVGQNQIPKYMSSRSNTIKDGPDEGPTLNQVANSGYVKAILPLDVIQTLEDYEISLLRVSSEKLPHPHKKGSPNPYTFTFPLQTSQRGRLHGYRMSLDGGMDRLQEIRHK